MRYLVVIDDSERRANDDNDTFAEAWDNVSELLRSGYYEVVSFVEEPDDDDEEEDHG